MVSAIHTMTKQQQLSALHGHLCECTTATGTKCGAFYAIFRMLGMDDLLIHERQALFNELQNMGFIAEYTHLPGAKWGIADRWTCEVINRNPPFTNTTNND
jgi:hypothetical protein